jgi:transcriptional regulator with XRE-family HTH domain
MKNRVREIRIAKGMTQARLAELVGTSHRNIQYIEKDERGIEGWMPQIGKALGVPEWQLITDPATLDYSRLPAPRSGLADGETKGYTEKIPVWGLLDANGETYALGTDDTPAEWTAPLPGLPASKGAFALLIGGKTMLPVLKPGHVAYADPKKAPVKNELCIIELKTGGALIKTYLRRTARELILEQLSPRREITVKLTQVRRALFVAGVRFK